MPSDPTIPLVHGKTNNKLKGKSLLYSVSVFLSIGVWLFGYVHSPDAFRSIGPDGQV
jgi:hypothetical protein